MNTAELRAANDKYIINTYGARKLALVRGEGSRVWDADGNEYLDFFAGIAVANLGHCHPKVADAICGQARTLGHVSNLYYTEPQVNLGRLLCEHSFADRWFFCNSGAEANESAIKIARRYWALQGTAKPVILAAQQSFHGRTLATLSATGQPKYHEGFEPLLPGIVHVPYNDVDSLAKAIKPDVGAILLEPIQGEGGVRVPADDYLRQVRELCDKNDLLLILDEVQTGCGRTGKLFAHEHAGVTPDVMSLAKALANGVPMGAMGCTEKVASGFSVGSHASTFGGNPVCSAAAVATLEVLLEPGFLEGAADVGNKFMAGLESLRKRHPVIKEVRGKGLMIGVEMGKPITPLMNAMIERRVVCGPAGPNVLRFLPPLIVTESEVNQVLSTLDEALEEF